MKVQAIREFHGNEGSVSAGKVIDVSASRARDLKDKGLVRNAPPKTTDEPSNTTTDEPSNTTADEPTSKTAEAPSNKKAEEPKNKKAAEAKNKAKA